MSTIEPQRGEQFLLVYSGCESQLFAYLLTLLGNRSDAEEVFQETALVLWRSFDDFTPGTNFLLWAKRIAFHRVLTFRKQRQRQGVPNSEEFLNSVERFLGSQSEALDARLRALSECLMKLSEPDRQLVALRYESNRKIKDLATQLGRPANTLYKAFERIRHALFECVDRSLAREERI
jgi:RNA polymerase sigma-70 factor, ECF subfamily